MTDVEARTPNKRRLSEKKAPASAKKAKITPQKPENKGIKQNNAPNTNGKFKKGKKNSESENGSPKKLKPFAGTSKIPNEQKTEGNKKPQQNKEKGEGKKPRRSALKTLKEKINSDEKDVALQSIAEKITAIKSRGDELTKSAKKKLKLLYRLQRAAGGEGQPQQEKSAQKTQKEGKQKKGSEVAKAPQANVGKKDQNKTPAKGQKANELNKNLVRVETKQVTKKTKQIIQEESSDEEDDDSDNDLEEEEDSDDEVGGEIEGEADDDDDDDDAEEEEDDSDEEGEEEEDSDEDDSEVEVTPPQVKKSDLKGKKVPKVGDKEKKGDTIKLEDLENNKIVVKNQKRYVVFVGNIPYDTNKQDLIEHFTKCGEIKHIRIPTEKKSSRPRGFAYVEVGNDESYQKCLSMHHTSLKGRRINVLYTQGGKKKGEEKKKEIKAKNFKLHAMRKEGKLAGSKKESQKRSFRRAKKKAQSNQGESQE